MTNELLSPKPLEQKRAVGPILEGLRQKPILPMAKQIESLICKINKAPQMFLKMKFVNFVNYDPIK